MQKPVRIFYADFVPESQTVKKLFLIMNYVMCNCNSVSLLNATDTSIENLGTTLYIQSYSPFPQQV